MHRDRAPVAPLRDASSLRFKIEAAKFLVVGGVNFVLTFIIFFVLVKLLHVNYLVGLTASWAAGMVFSYVLNFSWVFRPEEQLRFKARFGKFFLASLASLALNLLTLDFLVRRYGFDAFYVQCALIPLIVVFNFTTAKFWSLRAAK
ncbi:MAG: GtrA family protein [Luteimonas sp.]